MPPTSTPRLAAGGGMALGALVGGLVGALAGALAVGLVLGAGLGYGLGLLLLARTARRRVVARPPVVTPGRSGRDYRADVVAQRQPGDRA